MPIIDKGKTIISRNPEITAYEIAVANGFVGTEAQWLTSLIATPTYLVYTALISQSGTDAPTVVILENTLGAPIVWTRIDAGIYNGTLAAPFLYDKTFTSINTGGPLTPLPMAPLTLHNRRIDRIDDNIIQIITGNDASFSDDFLDFTEIEIRVYP